ncbi:hypothetical protein CGZ80_15785 [Rhodopirellula sp. MGV]|nr:hypothetical protein CGZ80_15785 [Rhodopirellula sp. MGV]
MDRTFGPQRLRVRMGFPARWAGLGNWLDLRPNVAGCGSIDGEWRAMLASRAELRLGLNIVGLCLRVRVFWMAGLVWSGGVGELVSLLNAVALRCKMR